MRKSIAVLSTLALLHAPLANAQLGPQSLPASAAREYFVGRDLGKPLVTVHLLNGVATPGVYHVPADTDIAQMIAYAGGATDKADLSNITIRRTTGGQYHITDLDLEKALREPTDFYKVQDNDVIRIDQQFSTDKTQSLLGIVSAITSIVLSFVIIRDMEERRN